MKLLTKRKILKKPECREQVALLVTVPPSVALFSIDVETDFEKMWNDRDSVVYRTHRKVTASQSLPSAAEGAGVLLFLVTVTV